MAVGARRRPGRAPDQAGLRWLSIQSWLFFFFKWFKQRPAFAERTKLTSFEGLPEVYRHDEARVNRMPSLHLDENGAEPPRVRGPATVSIVLYSVRGGFRSFREQFVVGGDRSVVERVRLGVDHQEAALLEQLIEFGDLLVESLERIDTLQAGGELAVDLLQGNSLQYRHAEYGVEWGAPQQGSTIGAGEGNAAIDGSLSALPQASSIDLGSRYERGREVLPKGHHFLAGRAAEGQEIQIAAASEEVPTSGEDLRKTIHRRGAHALVHPAPVEEFCQKDRATFRIVGHDHGPDQAAVRCGYTSDAPAHRRVRRITMSPQPILEPHQGLLVEFRHR